MGIPMHSTRGTKPLSHFAQQAKRKARKAANVTEAEAAALAEARLTESGLTPELQKEMGYRFINPAQCKAAKVPGAPYGAIELRYYDPTTQKPISFRRWRRLWPKDKPKPAKFVRYHTAKGQRQRPHF